MSLSKSRKRSYRYRVKCEECEKEFDFDYVEAHSRIVHSGRKVKCLPVVESSQLRLSGISKSSAAVESEVNNVLFHQHTNLLQISSQILNQSTKIHLSLMRQ